MSRASVNTAVTLYDIELLNCTTSLNIYIVVFCVFIFYWLLTVTPTPVAWVRRQVASVCLQDNKRLKVQSSNLTQGSQCLAHQWILVQKVKGQGCMVTNWKKTYWRQQNQISWNYNHQRDSPSWVLVTHLILGQNVKGQGHNVTMPQGHNAIAFCNFWPRDLDLWPNINLWARQGIVFGDRTLSSFGFIVRTNTQADRIAQTDRQTDANDRLTHATTVGVSN